jgi:hypothetical protein
MNLRAGDEVNRFRYEASYGTVPLPVDTTYQNTYRSTTVAGELSLQQEEAAFCCRLIGPKAHKQIVKSISPKIVSCISKRNIFAM